MQEMNIAEEVLRHLRVSIVDEPSSLVLLAIHSDFGMNEMTVIDCGAGTPISTFVHDHVQNQYKFFCRDFKNIGTIPVSFRLESTYSDWRLANIPAPPSVIERYLNEKQVLMVQQFKAMHPGDVIRFDYLQFTNH